MGILAPDGAPERDDKVRRLVERVSDAPSHVQDFALADPEMAQPLILRKINGPQVVVPPDPVVRVHPRNHALQREPAPEEVTDLKFAVTRSRGDVCDFLRRNAEAIASLEVCLA